MDVAQTFQEHSKIEKDMSSSVPVPESKISRESGSGIKNSPSASSPPLEKRKSSHDKYSAFAMPPVKEETPVSTPAGTMSRSMAEKSGAVELVSGDAEVHAVPPKSATLVKQPSQPVNIQIGRSSC